MDNKDIKSLEMIYEDLAGADYPQYGSNAPLVVAPIGTENLRSGYVDVPQTDEQETDDEDRQVKTSLEKLIDDIKYTIEKISDKHKEEKKREINNVLDEGFISSFAKGIQSDTIGSDVAKQASEYFQSLKKNNESEPIGDKNPPKINQAVELQSDSDVQGRVVDISSDRKRFVVDLKTITDIKNSNSDKKSSYTFAKPTDEIGWKIVPLNVAKTKKLKDGSDAFDQSSLTSTAVVGYGTKFPNWAEVKTILAKPATSAPTTPAAPAASKTAKKNTPSDGDKWTNSKGTASYTFTKGKWIVDATGAPAKDQNQITNFWKASRP